MGLKFGCSQFRLNVATVNTANLGCKIYNTRSNGIPMAIELFNSKNFKCLQDVIELVLKSNLVPTLG